MSAGQTTATEPTRHHTPNPTPEETAKNQGFKVKSVGVHDSVGKNEPFVGWCAVDVSDDRITARVFEAYAAATGKTSGASAVIAIS